MKRKLSVFLSAILSAAVLAGCNSAADPTGPINSGNDKPDQTNTVDTTDTTGQTDISDNTETDPQPTSGDSEFEDPRFTSDSAKETLKIYKEFLAGNSTVHVCGLYRMEDGDYTLEKLIQSKAVSEASMTMPDIITEGYYSFIDCGNDGEPELALKLVYNRNTDYPDLSTFYMIIRPIFGELTLITSQNSYYREYTTMNKYGYFHSSGGAGAAMGFESESFVTSDGEYYELLTCRSCFGMAEPKISQNFLPFSVSDELNGGNVEYSDAGYTLAAYRLEEAVSEEDYPDWEEYEAASSRQYIYTFYDIDDNSVMPDDDYIYRAGNLGYRIVSDSEMKGLISDHYAAYGATDEIREGEDPEWTSFEVTDKVSKSAQVDLFMQNTDMWLLPESEYEEGSYVKYCMADLNRNGRYEVIRSEKLSNNQLNWEFCRNRFFEVNEDFSGIYKIDYETENYWGGENGELGGWEHDLLNQPESGFVCYWRKFEVDDPSLCRTDYHYIIPTTMQSPDLDCIVTNKMVLTFDGDNRIPHGYSIGLKYIYYDGREEYLDDEGIDSDAESYETGNEEYMYGEYYNQDMVHIYFYEVDPSDKESVRMNLSSSADQYYYYTLRSCDGSDTGAYSNKY